MSFANPAGNASTAAASYVSALLELLGDKDPLSVQRELLVELRQIVNTMTRDQLSQPEGPGKWSAIEIVRHLMHTELVYAYRYRITVAQDKPNIPGFDQDAWASGLEEDGTDIDTILDRLSALRSWNIEFLDGRAEAEWLREGRHEERGWESLIHQAKLGAAHDLVHRAQLERCRKAVLAGT